MLSAGPRSAPDTVARLAARFRQRNRPCCWYVWADQRPQMLGRRLVEEGFRPATPAALLVAPTAGVLAATSDPGRRVERAVAGAQLIRLDPSWRDGYISCLRGCFALPAEMGAMAAEACLGGGSDEPAPITWAAVLGTTVLAVATAVVRESHGGLTWVGTHPDWRRRGLARAVSAAAVAAAAARGGRRSLVQAMPEAVSLYLGMGFARRGTVEVWSLAGPGCPGGRDEAEDAVG